jgi:hypothetical protein
VLKIIAWNIARRTSAWRLLVGCGADIALLQEATPPPLDIAARVNVDEQSWRTGPNQRWGAAIVRLADQAEVQWFLTKPLMEARTGELGVSRAGTISAATITPKFGESFIAVSAYALWERPLGKERPIYADASAHRLISDLCILMDSQRGHNILVAGDFNILFGYGEYGDSYWGAAQPGPPSAAFDGGHSCLLIPGPSPAHEPHNAALFQIIGVWG